MPMVLLKKLFLVAQVVTQRAMSTISKKLFLETTVLVILRAKNLVGGELGGVHDDDDVVWEFGGEGAYGKVSGATIDIVRGTARLKSENGFGEEFNNNESKVIVRADGALDLYGQSVTIDNLKFEGGTLQNTKEDSSATLESGFFFEDDVLIDVAPGASLDIKGVISSSDSEALLWKAGEGALVLSSENR